MSFPVVLILCRDVVGGRRPLLYSEKEQEQEGYSILKKTSSCKTANRSGAGRGHRGWQCGSTTFYDTIFITVDILL